MRMRKPTLAWLRSRVEHSFADPQVYRDADKARASRTEAERFREELATLNVEWESRIEEMG
jgi:hypothetical protein